MITNRSNPVEWALWLDELSDAHEHLGKLVNQLRRQGECSPEDFRIQLGHIYAHLNRAWHSRDHRGEVSEKDWNAYSEFPSDLDWT